MSNRNRVIDRKRRELTATKRSLRQVSELALNEDEETQLIDLLARLEGVNLKTAEEIDIIQLKQAGKQKDGKKSTKKQDSSDSDNSEEENGDKSSSDSEDSEPENDEEVDATIALAPVDLNMMTREKYMRRLIRTDRFERKQLRLGEVKSAESIAAKIRKTITTPSKTPGVLPASTPSASIKGSSRKPDIILPPSAPLVAAKAVSVLGPTVRVSVDIDKDKLRGKPKLMVFNRTMDMSEMLNQIRGKFNNAGGKFNALRLVPVTMAGKYKEKDLDNFKILDELDMMMLEDDTQIVLVAVDRKKLSYIPKELKDHQLPKAHEAHVKLSVNAEEGTGDAAADEEEKDSKIDTDADAVKKEELAKATAAQAWSEDWQPPTEVDNQHDYAPLKADARRSRDIKYTLYQTQHLIHNSKANSRRDPNKARSGEEDDLEDDEELYTANIKAQRESLPIYAKRDDILQALRDHQVMIVCGETGSGKTTQVAQYVLEEMIHSDLAAQCNIVCTEPRRIAAISVAQRVHEEVYHSYNMYGWNVDEMASAQQQPPESSSSSTSSASSLGPKVEALPTILPNKYGSYKPEVGKGLVGYSVRLESRATDDTKLLYCTTGVLLRKLQSESYLRSVSHIIIDEVHERGVETDFLMTILKQQLVNHPHLRVILMSATMQEEKFQAYFDNCPCIYVSGRTFPVAVKYMETIRPLISKAGNNNRQPAHNAGPKPLGNNIDEDCMPPKFDAEVVADVVAHIVAITSNTNRVIPGAAPIVASTANISVRGEAILVFLSGIQSIEKVQKALRARGNLRGPHVKIHILHSTVPPDQQRRVFKPTSPGEWKIVLATNIAETSITVDDITHVVDTGFMKEQRYNPATGINTLQEVFISRSNGKQRAGRAGRVKPGDCWRLFGEAYYTNGASRVGTAPSKGSAASKPAVLPAEVLVQEYSVPEIQRIALEEVILQVLYLRLGRPESFLTQCLSPPSLQQIKAAIACLIEIKAIYPKAGYPLTALGYHLAKMPVDVRIGKMLIYSSLLECVEPVLTIAAYLSSKTPFQAPIDKREDARRMHAKFLHYKEYLAPHKKRPVAAEGGSDSEEEDDDDDDDSEGDEELVENSRSDHIAVIHAYICWKKVYRTQGVQAARNFAREYYLSFNTMCDIDALRDYYREYLLSTGFIPKDHMKNQREAAAAIDSIEDELGAGGAIASEGALALDNRPRKSPIKGKKKAHRRYDDVLVHDNAYTVHRDLIRCAMCAGFFPNVIRAIRVSVNGKDSVKLLQSDNQSVNLHPSSLLMQNRSAIIPQECQDAFLVYYRKNEGDGNINIFDVSMIPHSVLLLFAGNEIVMANPGKKKNARRSSRIMLNGWIEMELSELHLACYRRIQQAIESLLRQKVENQQCDLLEKQGIIQSVLMILLALDE